jgi:signal peptidase I
MADSSSTEKHHGEGGVKETVEAILVAFILAFIFRAFVVEAFVIPTGSMAPTLYGAHMRLQCPDCGYTFDVNYTISSSGSEDPDDATVPNDAPMQNFHCPNCGYEFNAEEQHPVRFGDRILVLKYLYLFQKPTRWDVVVFKSPSEPGADPSNPDYSRNYIKRCVGLPNESIVILDGDVYVGPPNADENTPGSNDPARGWTIARKPKYAQDALWRTVFDNDYLPNANGRTAIDRGSVDAFHEPWTPDNPGAGWDVGTPAQGTRAFHFSNLTGNASLNFDPGVQGDLHRLTDYMPYDEFAQRQPQQTYPVSDLKLSAFYRLAQAGSGGELNMILTKDQDSFTAKLTPCGVELWQGRISSSEPFAVSGDHRVAGPVAVDWRSPSGGTQVDFANVDHRVTIRVGGKDLIQHDYDPNIPRLFAEARLLDRQGPPPIVRISAAREDCTLDHIVLCRDVYYLNQDPHMIHGVPGKIAHLGPGEYFVLGDNSPNSSDARYWGPQPYLNNWDGNVDLTRGEDLYVKSGRVPERFMLGKAFFVYWPAGYRPLGLPLGIVPDFGEMRFIH